MLTRYSVILIFLLGFMSLGGCASLLDFGSEQGDAADLDRGYTVEQNDESDSSQYSAGRDIASDSDADNDDSSEHRVKSTFRRAIETRDVVLGMSRNDVMESWGEPSMREVAGSGDRGHERWTYRSRYSLQRQDRVVIFENGKVAGWYR